MGCYIISYHNTEEAHSNSFVLLHIYVIFLKHIQSLYSDHSLLYFTELWKAHFVLYNSVFLYIKKKKKTFVPSQRLI